MQGFVPHGYGARRMLSSSAGLHGHWNAVALAKYVKQASQPASSGNRQSLWPAKPSTFTKSSQSQIVTIEPTTHGPTGHWLHPASCQSAGAVCALHAASAAAFGWHKLPYVHVKP